MTPQLQVDFRKFGYKSDFVQLSSEEKDIKDYTTNPFALYYKNHTKFETKYIYLVFINDILVTTYEKKQIWFYFVRSRLPQSCKKLKTC